MLLCTYSWNLLKGGVMKFVPDVLTGLRFVCALFLFWSLVETNWALALILLLVGMVTDAIDGEIARRLGLPKTSYGDVFDQSADGTLWGALFVGLWWSGQLSLIFLAIAVLGGVLLQAASYIPKDSKWWPVRRHAHWIHPFSYAFTLWVGLIALTQLTISSSAVFISVCCLYGAGVVVILHIKRLRIKEFLSGS